MLARVRISPKRSCVDQRAPVGFNRDLTCSAPSLDERRARGRQSRDRAAPSTYVRWQPAGNRPDPVGLLEEQNVAREPDLVPVRHGRMMVSPFTGVCLVAGRFAWTSLSWLAGYALCWAWVIAVSLVPAHRDSHRHTLMAPAGVKGPIGLNVEPSQLHLPSPARPGLLNYASVVPCEGRPTTQLEDLDKLAGRQPPRGLVAPQVSSSSPRHDPREPTSPSPYGDRCRADRALGAGGWWAWSPGEHASELSLVGSAQHEPGGSRSCGAGRVWVSRQFSPMIRWNPGCATSAWASLRLSQSDGPRLDTPQGWLPRR
jgi:hypothetical protein